VGRSIIASKPLTITSHLNYQRLSKTSSADGGNFGLALYPRPELVGGGVLPKGSFALVPPKFCPCLTVECGAGSKSWDSEFSGRRVLGQLLSISVFATMNLP